MRTCIACGDSYVGRADKKFCSAPCRHSHNNKRNQRSNAFIREVNKELRKNRGILLKFFNNNTSVIPQRQLETSGFNFDRFTELKPSSRNWSELYCYEMGLKRLDGKKYKVVSQH